MQDAFSGQTIGGYEIIERIGHGGMSEVFKACCDVDGGYVALKLLHSFHVDDPSFIYRFTREARVLAQLDHPNIVRVFDFDMSSDTPYIAMEYVGGGTLKDRFKQLREAQHIMPFADSLRIILELADALAYAHSRGLIHRDIKPANILFDGNGRAVLSDFGIVKMINNSTQHTQTGAMLGTPAYMSPEQGLGRTGDARSDVYALGVLFFQLMTGELPFDADKPLAVVLKHINEPIPFPTVLNPTIPEGIEQIILTALAKNPLNRFQTAREMANEIRHAIRKSDDAWARAIPAHLLIKRRPRHEQAADDAPSTETPLVPTNDQPISRRPLRAPKRAFLSATLLSLALLLLIAGIVRTLSGGDDVNVLTNTPAAALVASPRTTTPAAALGASRTRAATTRAAAPTAATTATPAAEREATATVDEIVQINATALYLASCDYNAISVESYTLERGTMYAEAGAPFTLNWRLRNGGICDLPAGVILEHDGGETFGARAPVSVPALAPGEEALLSTQLRAPEAAGSFSSTWRLVDADGMTLGAPLLFTVEVGEGPPPSSADLEALDINAFIQSCEYESQAWRCLLLIEPTGGSGRYTIRVEEGADQTEYGDVTEQLHLATATRCNTWSSNLSAEDQATGESITREARIDPTQLPVAALLDGNCSAAEQ